MRLAIIEDVIDLENGIISDSFEDALRSAIIVSLLTDRRANVDDVIPDAPSKPQAIPYDRRGWAGDALADVAGERVGSRLWLLSRAKQTDETRKRAIEYCAEALQWLIDDGHASSILVEASWISGGRLNLKITLILTSGDSFGTTLSIGVIYAV